MHKTRTDASSRVHVREVRFGNLYLNVDHVHGLPFFFYGDLDNTQRAECWVGRWRANVYNIQICLGILQLSRITILIIQYCR